MVSCEFPVEYDENNYQTSEGEDHCITDVDLWPITLPSIMNMQEYIAISLSQLFMYV